MKHYRLLLLMLTLSLLVPSFSTAQTTAPTDWLVVASNDGLLAWVDGAVQPISFCSHVGLSSPLIMAPNADHLAYRVTKSDDSSEIHLCHGIDRAEYTLPKSASIRVKNPVWSPDSRRVGWLSRGDPITQIDIYDLATRQLTTIDTGLRNPEEIYWATGGIFLQDTYEFYLYSLTGDILARFPIPESGFRSYTIAKVGSQEILVGTTQAGDLYSHPVGNGEWLPLSGVMQLTAPEASQPRLALNYDPKATSWRIVTPAGASLDLNYRGGTATLAIAPDGQGLAYVRDGQVIYWRSDTGETPLPLTANSLVWSPAEWQIVNP